ncbi:MAG: SPASM domain-containing protein [Bdellovibrionota bacterium]
MADPQAPKAFCTAPWSELHLLHDGRTRPCDHNSQTFGNWQEEGIEGVWKGKAYREFRRKITAGEFPDDQCRSCVLGQTVSNLRNHVGHSFAKSMDFLAARLGRTLARTRAFSRWLLEQPDSDWEVKLREARDEFSDLRKSLNAGAEALLHLERMELLARVAEDFLRGNETPTVVAPFRKVRIRNKCNARCIMCAGKFNGDIVNGPSMEEQFVLSTLDHGGDTVSYCTEISEFFLIPKWKEITARISADGMPRLTVFTNGMLLSAENMRYLVDHNALDVLHISMNAASKEVLEPIQVNVRYDQLISNIRSAVAILGERPGKVTLSFSFIIMKRNFHEMPLFVKLIDELTAGLLPYRPIVYFAYLETNNDTNGYRRFLFEEHPALAEGERLLRAYREANELGERAGIPIFLFEESLKTFLDTAREFPRLPCKPIDLEIVRDLVKEGHGDRMRKAVVPVSPRVKMALDIIFSSDPEALAGLDLQLFIKDDVVLSRRPRFPLTGFADLEESEAGKWRWALGARQEVSLLPFPGKNKVRFRLQVPQEGTTLWIQFHEGEPLKLESTEERQLMDGEFEFDWPKGRAPAPCRVQIEVERNRAHEPAVPLDPRPLSYAVFSFEHS